MKKKKLKPVDLDALDQLDSAIHQDYLTSTFGGDAIAADTLHQFFSPLRIPAGLTDEEARICVNLYPLRRAQLDRRLKKPKGRGLLAEISHMEKTVFELQLPDELSPLRHMTRKRFKEGILKFIAQVHT